MRIAIEIIGVGQRKAGISKKTQRAYDMTEYAIKYDHQQFAGAKAETIAIPAETIGNRKIAVGDILDVEMFQMNFKTYIGCIYG